MTDQLIRRSHRERRPSRPHPLSVLKQPTIGPRGPFEVDKRKFFATSMTDIRSKTVAKYISYVLLVTSSAHERLCYFLKTLRGKGSEFRTGVRTFERKLSVRSKAH